MRRVPDPGVRVSRTSALLAFAAVITACPPAAASGSDTRNDQAGAAESASGPGEESALTERETRRSNRLIDSTSQYLLQHAHNPVDWFPWGDEAFERAKAEDKAIFLSVGYSTCYWCHVMEREIFEHEEIAAQMNESFICVKVDREQRPDVDELYMMATQIFSGHGGWPNSVFLTPDLKPFYCGTYFGPEDMPGGRPGFPRVLTAIDQAWRTQRDEVTQQANLLAERVALYLGAESRERASNISADIEARALQSLRSTYDDTHGGWGIAPKFPSETAFPFLARMYKATGDESLLSMAQNSLAKMQEGAIFDQVGGGFHRYATDQSWRVPHFEKMLYNQAQLAIAYMELYQIAQDPQFEHAARRTLDFVLERMTDPQGGFYSAMDAETDATEGKPYVWTEAEIRNTLSDNEAELYLSVFALAPVPKIPGHAHANGGGIYWRRPVHESAAAMDMSVEDLLAKLAPLQRQLLDIRDQREAPLLDTKIICEWNGMMICALALGHETFGDPRYRDAALKAGEFVSRHLTQPDERLWRIWRDGTAEIDAFHDDYAWMTRASIALFGLSDDRRWLDRAVALQGLQDDLLWDEFDGGYFFSVPQRDLFARTKSPHEGALPSGNSVTLHSLLSLYEILGDQRHLARADELILAFGALIEQNPGGYTHFVDGIARRRGIDQPIGSVDKRPADFIDRLGPPRGSGGRVQAPAAADAPVKLVAEPVAGAVHPGSQFDIVVTVQMARGWHINSDQPGDPSLTPTRIDVRSDSDVQLRDVEYPKSTELRASYATEAIQVFAGDVVIVAKMQAPPTVPEDGQLRLRIVYQYQACDETSCQAPESGAFEIAVPMQEAARAR